MRHAKNNFYADNILDYDEGETLLPHDLRTYLIKVYNYMALGLTFTGAMAFITASSPRILEAILTTPLAWVVVFLPIGLAYYLSARIYTLTLTTAKILFWVYAGVLGVSLSSVFIAYTGISIAKTFIVTAIAFATTGLYANLTSRDLSHLDAFLFMGLVALLLGGVVNLFLKSSFMETLISSIGIILFVGLTAYDIQRIKLLYTQTASYEDTTKKALLGALALYLDYINLFLYLLHFTRQRRKHD